MRTHTTLILSDHCIRRYRERIRPDLSFTEATNKLLEGMGTAKPGVYKGSSGIHWEFPDCIVVGRMSSNNGSHFTATTCYEKEGGADTHRRLSLLGEIHALLSAAPPTDPLTLRDVTTLLDKVEKYRDQIDEIFRARNGSLYGEEDRGALLELRWALSARLKPLKAEIDRLRSMEQADIEKAAVDALKAAFILRRSPNVTTLDAFDAEIEKLRALSPLWDLALKQIEADRIDVPTPTE